MNAPTSHRPALLVVGAIVLAVIAVAVIKRDAIADLILRGSDTSLTGEAAQKSPHAVMAVEFLGALRAKDAGAVARLTAPDQAARIQQESALGAEMLSDLPADATELVKVIKSVQTHDTLAVVLFETRANSWYVQLARSGGAWKVSGI